MTYLGEGVAAANHPQPPLSEPRDASIVQGHFLIDAPDLPPGRAQSNAEFRFFPGNQIVTIPPTAASALTRIMTSPPQALASPTGTSHSASQSQL